MGQKIILSKEEKRNIQKMYGMINEQEDQKERQVWLDISIPLQNYKSPRKIFNENGDLLALFWGMNNPYNDRDSKVSGNSFKGGWNLSLYNGELEFIVETHGPGKKHNDARNDPSPYGKGLIDQVSKIINKYGFNYRIFNDATIIINWRLDGNMEKAPKIENLVYELLNLLPTVKPSEADREFARSKSKFDGYK